MKIAGLQKNSMVDYPGKISAVVFTQGCNMNCGYCHNRRLIGHTGEQGVYNEDSILAFLEKRRGLLDGVVVSGGEPTLQKDLPCFLERVKKMGFRTKLDTNGTDPVCLKNLLSAGLLDYVAMDVKAPMCKYGKVCCSAVNTEKLMESIDLIKDSSVEYEFRTTYTPELDGNDLIDISRTIRGARKYVLQQYREVDRIEGSYTGKAEKRNILKKITDELMESVGTLQFRGDFVLI